MPQNILSNHPVFQKMSKEKQEFILSFQNTPKPQNMKQALPFLMKYKATANQKNIHFDKKETELLVDILCKSLPEKERLQIQNTLRLFH